jgi:hypothetical protein
MDTYKTYAEKLKDPRWQKRRLDIFNRDGFACQACRDDESTLHVHHLDYGVDPWEIDGIYLITLCESCHFKEEQLKSTDILGKVFARYGLTRLHVLRLLEHCAYRIEKSDIKDRPRFEPLASILEHLVSSNERHDYVQWLQKGGRING